MTTTTMTNNTRPISKVNNNNKLSTSGITTATSTSTSSSTNISSNLNNNSSNNNEFNPNDICSPHELIGWVDDVLEKLENKFSKIESEVLERLDVLGKRIDTLESSMSGLLDGAANNNPNPSTTITTIPTNTTSTQSNQPSTANATTSPSNS